MQIGRDPLDGRSYARVASGLDLADEQTLPVSRFFHRLDGSLVSWFHTRDGEVVHRHAIADALIRDIEPEMLDTASSVPACASAPSPDRHRCSSALLFLMIVPISLELAPRPESSPARRVDESASSA